MFVYADNAATTSISDASIKAMMSCFRHEDGKPVYDNPSSVHTPGRKARQYLESARMTVARDLNAAPSEIVFTSGGSEADNQALRSAAEYGAKQRRKHVVSTKFEHHAVLRTLSSLKKSGFEITLLDIPPDGVVTLEQVKNAVRKDTCLVSVMFANNEIGTVQPIREIGAFCREAGVLFHTDAVQAAGHLPIDVQAMNIDLLSLSGHKFHGPKGTGALYAREGRIPLASLIYGGAQEWGRRAGTENVAGICGMAVALDEACTNMEEHQAYVKRLRNRLMEGFSSIPHSILNGDPEHRLPGNVNFCFEGVEGEALVRLLDQKGIAVSSGSACASGSSEPSHVLLAMGRPYELARSSIRLTVCEENTPEQIEYILEAVPEIVEYLRSVSHVWKQSELGKRPYLLP